LNMAVTSPPPQLDYSRSRPSLSLAASIGSRSSSKNLGGEAGGCAKFARRPRVALTNAWSPGNPHRAGLQAARGYPLQRALHARADSPFAHHMSCDPAWIYGLRCDLLLCMRAIEDLLRMLNRSSSARCGEPETSS
jgi:hypothetical protein